jgi:mediator of RNA polymerase II transcription subunit 14
MNSMLFELRAVEANATSLVLKLLSLPKPLRIQQPTSPASQQTSQASSQQQLPPVTSPDQLKTIFTPTIEERVWTALLKRILSVSVRAQFNKINQTRIWTVEFVFFGTPLPSSHSKEQGWLTIFFFNYFLACRFFWSK